MEKGKIVIIDDDPDIRDTLQIVLEAEQYAVETAADRVEGMEKIRSNKPDLIILDVMMTGWHDGFEMARELKEDAEHKERAILMLTGVKRRTGIDFRPTAGDPTWCPVDGFLEKPVEESVLLAEVARLLSGGD